MSIRPVLFSGFWTYGLLWMPEQYKWMKNYSSSLLLSLYVHMLLKIMFKLKAYYCTSMFILHVVIHINLSKALYGHCSQFIMSWKSVMWALKLSCFINCLPHWLQIGSSCMLCLSLNTSFLKFWPLNSFLELRLSSSDFFSSLC